MTDFLETIWSGLKVTHGCEAVPRSALPRQTDADKAVAPFDASNDLEDLTRLSLAKARALSGVRLDVGDLEAGGDPQRFDHALQVAKLQLGVVDRILTTQTRVDEARLRKRETDILPRLMALIAEEKRALAKERTIDAKAIPQNLG
jgi:hypothetical protein